MQFILYMSVLTNQLDAVNSKKLDNLDDVLFNNDELFNKIGHLAVYRGQMYNDAKQGFGRYIDAESGVTIYDGEWKNDQRHGYGVELYNGEIAYKGYWAENERSGLGIAYDPFTGSILFEGLWYRDQPVASTDVIPSFLGSVVSRKRSQEETIHTVLYYLFDADVFGKQSNRASCTNTCRTLDLVPLNNDGECDEEGSQCPPGSDCADCGVRHTKPPLSLHQRLLCPVVPMLLVFLPMLLCAAACLSKRRLEHKRPPVVSDDEPASEKSSRARGSIRMRWRSAKKPSSVVWC